MFSPNALKILDKLGVYDRLRPLAYCFQQLHFYIEDNILLDIFDFGYADKYGYDGMCVYRFELINLLLDTLAEAGITSLYGHKFITIE